MLGQCSAAQIKDSDDAFDGTEEFKSARRDDSVRSRSTLIVQCCCWQTAIHYRSETRKSTSCTLCYVDQFLLTSECRGQGTVALSSGESELYALGALSAEMIFAQAILKEIGLSFLIHARADSSTARAVATKQGEILIHSRFGISETSNDVISQD